VPLVAVPAEAVTSRAGRAVVFEVVGEKVKERAVTAGGERDGKVVVKEGLLGTETLVARPPETLKDGDAVRIKR
jgi:multidrug efflux pump subunit AcrA (membrane-fusion protein)